MATTDLRRADLATLPADSGGFDIQSPDIDLEEWVQEPVSALVEDYPFSQDRIVATLQYHEPSQYTPGREIPIRIEYRTGSRLLLVDCPTDLSSLQPLLTAFEDIPADSGTIYRSLHAPEDKLWSFIESADRILEITVLVDGQEVPYQEVEDVPVTEVIGEYAIESAEVGFVHDDHQVLVSYQEGRLQVNTDWDEGREYILQLFEREVLADS